MQLSLSLVKLCTRYQVYVFLCIDYSIIVCLMTQMSMTAGSSSTQVLPVIPYVLYNTIHFEPRPSDCESGVHLHISQSKSRVGYVALLTCEPQKHQALLLLL